MSEKKICAECGRTQVAETEGRIINGAWGPDKNIKEHFGKWVCGFACYDSFYRGNREPKLSKGSTDLAIGNLPSECVVKHEHGDDSPIVMEGVEAHKANAMESRRRRDWD